MSCVPTGCAQRLVERCGRCMPASARRAKAIVPHRDGATVRASHSYPVARMSSPSNVADSPITHRDQLVDYIASGGKPKADWRIGTEHEKFGFQLDDLRPPTFDGERGIEALLKGLARFGWEEVREQVGDAPPRTIALLKDGASV